MQVNVKCLCGRITQTVTLAAEKFPVDTILDHSNAARYSTGLLFASYLPLARPPLHRGSCREYDVDEETSCLFCNQCLCHIFRHRKSNDEHMVASGIIQHDGDVIKVVGHEQVEETLDGGVVPFIQSAAQAQLMGQAQETGEGQLLTKKANDISAQEQPPRKMLAQCHCGGVRFFVTPPDRQSEDLSSPWPDVLVPYHVGSSENSEDVKWWLRANKSKYLAGLCACRSCRLSSGFPIQAWAFIPKPNVLDEDDRPFNMEAACLKRFESSPGVYRESCMTCGATVFWHSDERPDLIDVSVGLLRAPCGARAERLLEWDRHRVSFIEDGLDLELAKALELCVDREKGSGG